MDKVRVSPTSDPLPRGPSVFIPFECYNIQPDGSSDSKIAIDLPPMKTIHMARMYILNNRALANRAIDYREYSEKEIKASVQLMTYFNFYKGSIS